MGKEEGALGPVELICGTLSKQLDIQGCSGEQKFRRKGWKGWRKPIREHRHYRCQRVEVRMTPEVGKYC
jgi:uncharacterized protein YjlB